MKRFISLVLVFAIGIIGVALGHTVKAQSAVPTMTDEHIARIRSNCVEAQSTLYQLHASDALLRVNRGQLYESISTKLMTPFNSRVTLNKLDSVRLITVATTYERQLDDFRASYQQYEEAMSRTLAMNCMNQPVAFYDSVGETRDKRNKVNQSTLILQKTLQDYKDAFEQLAKNLQETSK